MGRGLGLFGAKGVGSVALSGGARGGAVAER